MPPHTSRVPLKFDEDIPLDSQLESSLNAAARSKDCIADIADSGQCKYPLSAHAWLTGMHEACLKHPGLHDSDGSLP